MRSIAAGLVLTAAGAFAMAATPPGDGARELRISLDTGPNHLRTHVVRNFAERLDAELPGRFNVRLFDSGQLYSDRDVIKALMWGDVDLALPTALYVARFEPAANVTSLPMFYGRAREVLHHVLDGPLGAAVADRMEARLAVKVLAPNLDLGYINVFSTRRPLASPADLAGLKVRVPGGAAALRMFRLQGASPVAIPWSDVPLGLSQGNIDAVATSFETLQSGSLWEVGIRHGLVERSMFMQYMPLVRREFWERLDPDTQARFIKAWRETMLDARELAAQRQLRAREIAIDHGIRVRSLSEAEARSERERLLQFEPRLVQQLRLPADVVELARSLLAAAQEEADTP